MKAAFGMAVSDSPRDDMDWQVRRHEKALGGINPQSNQMLSSRGIEVLAMLPAKSALG